MARAWVVLGAVTVMVSLLGGCKKPTRYRSYVQVAPETVGFGSAKDEKFALFADGKKLDDVDRDLMVWVPADVWLTKAKLTLRMPTTCGASDDVVLAPKVTPDVEESQRGDTPENVDLPFTATPPVSRYTVVIDNLDGLAPLHVTIGATAFDVDARKALTTFVRVGQCGWPDVTVGGKVGGPLPHAKLVKFGEAGGESILVDGTGTHCYLAHDIAYTAPGEHVAGKAPARFGPGWTHAIADVQQWFDPGPLEVESTSAFTRRIVSHSECGAR